jgi:hypothetical protein
LLKTFYMVYRSECQMCNLYQTLAIVCQNVIMLRLCISCQFKSFQRMGINIWYRIFSSCELSVVVVHRKLFQRSSPLKLLDQLEPNLVWIITRVSSFKIVSCDAVHQSTWPLLLKIDPLQNNLGRGFPFNVSYQHCCKKT